MRARPHDVAIAVAAQAVDPDPGDDRQLEALGVGLEAVAPVVAHAVVGLEDHERAVPLGQVVADGQACLPGADDDGLEVVAHASDRTAAPSGPASPEKTNFRRMPA